MSETDPKNGLDLVTPPVHIKAGPQRVTGEPWTARGVVTFTAVREARGWRVVNWHTTE